MKIFNLDGELCQEAEDVLYEIGNMGAGSVAVSIGNIREIEFSIAVPNVYATGKDIFSEIKYTPDQIVVGVSTKVNNMSKGGILFLLSLEFVRNTVEIMTGEKYEAERMLEDEDCLSAIQEMINYMTAGYVKILGAYLNVPVFISTASVGVDMVKNILNEMAEGFENKEGKFACVDTEFGIMDENGHKTGESGQVIIFPDEGSIEDFIKIME